VKKNILHIVHWSNVVECQHLDINKDFLHENVERVGTDSHLQGVDIPYTSC